MNEEIEQKASKRGGCVLAEGGVNNKPARSGGGQEGSAPFSCTNPYSAKWSAKGWAPQSTTKRLVQASERKHRGRERGMNGEIVLNADRHRSMSKTK